jgi:NAD(P)-dependent dehydrogenase (short-subunit alcohol dehydrogenase family)
MKIVVITGATSGIGLAILKQCLEQKYGVIGIGRADDKINNVLNEFNQYSIKGKLWMLKADLMDADEIDRVAEEIKKILIENTNGHLYSLINNAGCVRGWYSTNSNGYEQQFALNHLAAFRLTYQLLPMIIKAKGRILTTSSRSHQKAKINWQDIMFEKRYHPLRVYMQSKLANVMFTFSLNQKYQKQGLNAYAVDPGLVNTRIGLKNSGKLVSFVWNLRRKSGTSPEIPAQTYLYILNQKNPPEGLYYKDSASHPYNSLVNEVNSNRLFELSENMCGIKYGDNL